MAFRNRDFGSNQRPVYEHDEIEIEYRGIKAKITKNGKVILHKDDGEEFDEIEIPANLIFKLTNLLNNTRKVKFEDKDKKE